MTIAKTNRFPRALDRRLAWVVAGLLPLFIFAIVMFVVFTRQQEQAIERLLHEAASGAAHLVDRAVGEQLGIMNGMAASSAFDLGDLDNLRLEAQRLSEMHPEWRTVIVTDEHRQLLNLRTPPGEPMPAPRDPESLARVLATGRAAVGNLVNGQIGFRVPVVSGGCVAHTIAVPVDPRFFRDILAGGEQPRPWSAAVVGSDRGVITATPESPLKQGQPLPADMAQDASGFSSTPADYLAWAPVGASGWNVLIVAPATAVERPFVRTRTGVLLGGACAAALTAFLVMFLSSAWAARRETVGLKSEIAERKRAEDDLVIAIQRLALAHEAANSGAWEWDLRTNANVWSDELWRLYGLDLHGCVPSYDAWLQTVHPDDRAGVAQTMRAAAEAGVELYTEWRVHAPGEPERWLMSRGRALKDADGNAVRYIGIVVDITQRKMAEKALGESEERLRTFGAATFEGIVFSTGGRVVDCNDQFARMLGYEQHDLIGKPLTETVPPEALDRLRQNFELNREDVYEHEMIRRDGSRIMVEAHGRPVQSGGRLRCTAVRDISEHRKTQQALRESEEQFRRFAESANEGIWALDTEQRVTFANQRMADILGHTIEDMIGRPAVDFIHEQDLADHRLEMEQRRRGERASYERRMRHRDGTPIWVLISAAPILDAEGRFSGSFGMFTDITARKAADEAMRESEERFRLTFDTSPDSININRLDDGLYVDVNQGFTALSGWQREEVLGRTSLDINIWHDPADRRRLVDRLNATGVCDNLQAQFRRKDGSLTTALMSARVISLKGVRHIVSITRDISKRIEAETAMRESEERYRQVVDLVPDAISIFVDERFVFTNRSGLAMVDAPDFEALRDRPIWDVCHPRYISRGKQRYRECLREDRPLPAVEFELVGLGGRSIWVESSALPIPYKGQRALLAVWRDVTSRKTTEAALRENEELFRGTFDFSPVGQTMSDLDYRYLRCNEAFCRFLGYAEADLVGRSLFELTHPDDRNARSVIRDLLTGTSDHARFQKRYLRKDGSLVWGDVTVRLVLSPEGTPRHMLSVVQDITEKVRDAEQKEKLESQLRQAQKMEALGTLAGGIAHDFNNILGVIIGGAEMLELTDAARGSSEETLANVLGASYRAKDLVKQILAFSRHTKQEKILLNLKPLIRETVEFMRASLPSTIQLRSLVDPASGAVVADPTQMQQVMMNLCTNAAHAMEKEGGELQIRLATVSLDAAGASFDADLKPGRYTRLTVSDTGHGIEPAVMQRIFEPYFTTKEKGKGTGLGLAVVHGIVKAHNGAITVASEPGRGSTFEVFLPCVEGQAGEADANAPEPLPTGTERILLVDDEQALVETERQILSLLGYRVQAMTSPLDALVAFQTAPHAFDLVLTDMTMPQMTGMKMASRMMELRPDLPVLVCTGFSDQVNQAQAHTAGIKALLMKPLMARELAEAIRKALAR